MFFLANVPSDKVIVDMGGAILCVDVLNYSSALRQLCVLSHLSFCVVFTRLSPCYHRAGLRDVISFYLLLRGTVSTYVHWWLSYVSAGDTCVLKNLDATLYSSVIFWKGRVIFWL